jgi:hypothetical protein
MREPPSARCLPAAQHRKSATEPSLRGCPRAGGPGRGKMYCHCVQLRDSRPGCRRGAAVGGVSRAHLPTVYVWSAGGWLRSRLDEAARNRSAYSEVRESGGKLATTVVAVGKLRLLPKSGDLSGNPNSWRGIEVTLLAVKSCEVALLGALESHDVAHAGASRARSEVRIHAG